MSDRSVYHLTPSTEELVEARERADAGLRLVFPQMFDRPADMDRADGLGAETDAEGLMADLEQEVDEAAKTLGKLLERVDLPERSLAAAVFNRFGVDLVELREQLPTLREAVRERGGRS
ncbi:MAG TPA: hypothetical protein VJW23_07905 [Propionibacteriaceae bacterium]|nr:hypothetical protein [Propionibacteriaceae bacterium]